MTHSRGSRSRAILLAMAACCFAPTTIRAGDYEEDIKNAVAQLTRIAGEVGLTRDERDKYVDAIKRYGDERERMLNEMLSLLAHYDPSDIQDGWANLCDKGKELVERLDESSGPQTLKEIGLGDFVMGEQKIFDLNHKAMVAWSAAMMVKLAAADEALIKKFQEDIGKVRDGDKTIEAQLEACQSNASKEIKEFAKAMADRVVKELVKTWAAGKPWQPLVDWLADHGSKVIEERYRDVKEKRVLKQILLDDIKYVEDAHDQLSVEWIDEVFKKGKEAAENLPGAGSHEEYKAKDWEKFRDRAINDLGIVCERSKEKSKTVFEELLPAFREEVKSKFACAMDDPSKLADWWEEIDDQFKTMDDLFEKSKSLLADLSDGNFKKALIESMDDARNKMAAYVKLLKEQRQANEDVMKP